MARPLAAVNGRATLSNETEIESEFKTMSELETIEVFGPKGRAIINLCDLQSYRAKGFKTENEVLAEKTKAKEKREKEKGKPFSIAIESMTVTELKEYAEDNDIDISGLTKKADIIEAIQQAEAGQDEEPEPEQE